MNWDFIVVSLEIDIILFTDFWIVTGQVQGRYRAGTAYLLCN